MGVFQIPGNIKQEILPFVLNPEAGINKPVDGGSTNLREVPPQYFTYKGKKKDLGGGIGKLNLFPSVYNNSNFKLDLSYQMLYRRNANGTIAPADISLESLLNSVPGIQIREYLPDTRLDQCLNFFIKIFDKLGKMTSDNKQEGDGQNGQSGGSTGIKGFFKKLWGCMEFSINYLLGTIQPNFLGNISEELKGLNPAFGPYNTGDFLEKHGSYVLKFPYTLYYTLQSCVTTNIYEIPAIQSSKRISGSEGSPGWTGANSTGMRLTSLLKMDSLPMVGKMLNGIFGNIAIDYLPWWNAEAGSKTKEPEVTIEFDLFNDSAKAAMINFIFINTIVPHNKWIQYHFFQHSSSLYDIKIEGINRLFACAGDFEVTYQGVLRDPPNSWLATLCNKYANTNSVDKKALLENLKTNKIIKIPDVYHVQLKFQSLLPANFNNFIYNYSSNNNITQDKSKFGYYDGAGENAFNNAMTNFFNAVGQVWDNNGKFRDDDNVKAWNKQKFTGAGWLDSATESIMKTIDKM